MGGNCPLHDCHWHSKWISSYGSQCSVAKITWEPRRCSLFHYFHTWAVPVNNTPKAGHCDDAGCDGIIIRTQLLHTGHYVAPPKCYIVEDTSRHSCIHLSLTSSLRIAWRSSSIFVSGSTCGVWPVLPPVAGLADWNINGIVALVITAPTPIQISFHVSHKERFMLGYHGDMDYRMWWGFGLHLVQSTISWKLYVENSPTCRLETLRRNYLTKITT